MILLSRASWRKVRPIVRSEKVLGLQWVQFPPGNWVAPAGSYRSGGGGNETGGAVVATEASWRRCDPTAGRTGRGRGEFRCQSIFSRGGRPRRRRLTDDAEAMGNDLDPVLCTVGPATAYRRPHAIQLLGRLCPTDLPSPAGPTCRLSATELLPFRERVQDGIGMPGAMPAVARPGRLARIGHHRGPHRVGLDVPQNDEQVVAVLDDRGSEAALPDVAAGSPSPVVPPGVSDGQGLEDAADRLPGGRLEKQMKMVGRQAVTEFRCQSIFSRGGRPRRRGSRTMPRRWEMTSTQSSAP